MSDLRSNASSDGTDVSGLGGTRPSEDVMEPEGHSGPDDTREALKGALERVLGALSDPSATRGDLLTALLDLWVAESRLADLLAE